jgi:hypothetical protein
MVEATMLTVIFPVLAINGFQGVVTWKLFLQLMIEVH